MKTRVTLSLDVATMRMIENKRGLVSRSAFIADIIEKWVEGKT